MKNKSPKLQHLRGGKEFLLLEDYYISVVYNGVLLTFLIKAGFVWDGASVPWIGRTILNLSRTGKLDKMSVLHDALYVAKGFVRCSSLIINVYIDARFDDEGNFIDGRCVNMDFTRVECEELMRLVMLQDYPEELSMRQINIIYRTVVLFGWYKWIRPKRPETIFIHDDYKN